MSRQLFLFNPKFNKKPIYNSLTNKYQEFFNAYTVTPRYNEVSVRADYAFVIKNSLTLY